MKNRVGIMQGRLSKPIKNRIQTFPHQTWRDEFELAHSCGFNAIEWIFDNLDNPILTEQGIKEIRSLSIENNVFVDLICADFFMFEKLFNVSSTALEKNLNTLKKLIESASKLGIKIIEIPLVDSSSLKSPLEKSQFQENLKKILHIAEANNVIINLETDLPPLEFKNYIESFDSSFVRVIYDVGDRASLGYNVEKELRLLSKFIANIHIKDRLLNSHTVPLGEGSANFDLFFNTLNSINYSGTIIIQGAREDESKISSFNTCKKYLRFVKHYLD